MQDKMLDTISEYAQQLKRINLRQLAGDYDYLVAWMNSTKWNNGEHLPPHPAGENTVDEYSHNCPIPFYNPSAYAECEDKNYALYLLESIRDLINEISSSVTDEIEVTALNAYKEYTNNVIEQFGGEPGPGPEPPGPTPVDRQALFGILSATSDTKFEFGDDELCGIMYKDIDIDTTFGSAVTIPDGYRIDSVKSMWTFEFNTIETNGKTFILKGIGQNEYCEGDYTSAIGLRVQPALYILQITAINSVGEINDCYRLSVPSSKYNWTCPLSISGISTNMNGNFFELEATYSSESTITSIANSVNNLNLPSSVHYFDANGTEVYHLNLPKALWEFNGGTFSWLGDVNNKNDLAYYYKRVVSSGTPVRIHCVHE